LGGFQDLQDIAEDSCFVKIDNDVILVDSSLPSSGFSSHVEGKNNFKLIAEPETEEWIRVINSKNQVLGWLLITQKSFGEFEQLKIHLLCN
jgi:hypothetical protein